jgi:hypothetical protein
MIKSATFSADRKRRFDLVRDWRDEIGAPDKTALIIMLNPSKAGEEADDPTIRKDIGFARRWGFGRMVACNLVPIVSTDPWGLPPWSGIDHENIHHICQWAKESDLIVAAWGNQPNALCRTIALAEHVYNLRNTLFRDLHCIGVTKGGEPLHPSRAPYTLEPVLWREAVIPMEASA